MVLGANDAVMHAMAPPQLQAEPGAVFLEDVPVHDDNVDADVHLAALGDADAQEMVGEVEDGAATAAAAPMPVDGVQHAAAVPMPMHAAMEAAPAMGAAFMPEVLALSPSFCCSFILLSPLSCAFSCRTCQSHARRLCQPSPALAVV
jgi:hypothetical protein